MKNSILKIAGLMLAVLTIFPSCTKREMTVMFEPTELTLNVSPYSKDLYDLKNSEGVTLTCAGQPDYGRQGHYGFNCPCEYRAEVSLDKSFKEGTYKVLSTTSSDPRFTVDAVELAADLTELTGLSEENFPIIREVFFRVKCIIKRDPGAAFYNTEIGAIYSNVVSLKRVKIHYALAPVVPPAKMAIIGAFCDWSWSSSFDMVTEWYDKNGDPCGTFWRLMYVPAECGMKFNIEKAWDGSECGYAAVEGRITDNAGAGVTASGDGNIVITNAGWYIFVIRTAVIDRKYQYSFTVQAPDVYLFGDCNGGAWEPKEEWKFSVPADASGEFVSPAFAADGEVRATVIIDPANWWHSEFLVFGNKLVYRANGDDQERVKANAGQKIHINFTDGTGSIK